MRGLTIGSLVLFGVSLCVAQTPAPATAIVGAGFANPFPIPVAPGQVLTLFVQSSTITNPFGFPLSAVFWNGSADEAMPVLQVNQTNAACTGSSNTPCANLLAVTVQIPFDAPTLGAARCFTPFLSIGLEADLHQRPSRRAFTKSDSPNCRSRFSRSAVRMAFNWFKLVAMSRLMMA